MSGPIGIPTVSGDGPARRLRLALGLLIAAVVATGCAPVGYLAQSVGGHLRLVAAARPVSDWLVDGTTSDQLRQRLLLSQRMRDFAVSELKLPDNASYRRYADIGRAAAVWNVVAAPPLSLQLKTWCYPVVGCVAYRGFYDRQAAEDAAEPLRAAGLDVLVYGVPAYSTLGKLPGDYFADPLLNTFVNYPEGALAGLIFHELTHQLVYAAGDTVFNESFASAVERIGVQRWLSAQGNPQAREQFARDTRRREEFRELTQATRVQLEAVFESADSDEAKRLSKEAVMTAMRERYLLLKRERWGGFAGYDGWMASANNASLGLVAAYNSLVPGFERLFESNAGDFDRFYDEVRRLATLPEPQRRAALGAESH
nr:putative aminopeptidase [uncultured bacterium]